MDFLKKHYEKVILLGLFVLFIALMFFVLEIIAQSRELKEKGLDLPKRVATHEKADPKDAKFDTARIRENTKLVWNTSANREGSDSFSDLIHVFEIAVCPYCNDPAKSDRLTLIPFADFSNTSERNKSCQICGKHLPIPPERKRAHVGIKSKDDLDGDGIRNEDETKFGLDPNDPADALYDNDHDGFSNRFEIANGNDPNNQGDHPPYWWRLRLKDVAQIELPVKFMALSDNGSTNKKEWDLQFNSPHPRIKGRIRSQFGRIGDAVEIDGREYRIDDVERRVSQVKLEGSTRQVDKSRIFLTEIITDDTSRVPDKLTMTLGQPAYSSDKRPVLEDVGIPGGRIHAMRLGDTLYVGNLDHKNLRRDRSAGRYRVMEVDAEAKIVKIVDLRGSSSGEASQLPMIEITADGKVPHDARPVEKKDRNMEPVME